MLTTPVSSEPAYPSSRHAWWSAIAITLVFTVAFVHRIGLGLYVEPMKRALGLSDTQIGLLTGACFAIPYTVGGLLCGWLADRTNRVRLLAMSAVVWSAATAALGVLSSFMLMALARVVTGIGQAAVQPASGSLLADLFPPGTRARAYGLFVAGTAFGTAAAFLLGAASVRLGDALSATAGIPGWRLGLIMLGAMGVVALVALLWIREPARHERALQRPSTLAELLAFCRQHWRVLLTLFAGVTFAYLAPYGQLAFMPALFERKYGWSADDLALAFGAIAVVAGGGGSFVGGWLGDRWRDRGRRDSAWRLCFYGSVLSLLPAIAAPLADSAWMALFLYGVAGLFTNWPSVGALAAIAELAPNELRGQINAGSMATIGLIAAGFGPLTVALLTDRVFLSESALDRSLAWTFAGCTVVATLALAAGWRAYLHAIGSRHELV